MLLALVCALYVAARVWRLDASCLWFDEIYGVHAAAWHGWGGGLRFVALDLIHPPLFYALLKVWVAAAGAGSVWWLRLLPVLVSALAVVPLALLARELQLGARALSLALLLAAASGTLIKYAQELRMYSLLLLFATCSLWLFARFFNAGGRAAPRAALALFAVNLALVYTHYFGWLFVGLEVVFLALCCREKLKLFAASIAALALCFAPWAWAVFAASREAAGGGLEQNLGWAARPRVFDLILPFLQLHEPFRARQQSNEPAVLTINAVLAAALFAPPFFILCRRAFARRRAVEAAGAYGADDDVTRAATRATRFVTSEQDDGDDDDNARLATKFLLFFAFAPVVAAFALALALPQSVWGTRHLIISAPAYLLLAALALERLRPLWLAVAVKLLLACWLLLAAALALVRDAQPPVWCAFETLALQAAQIKASTPERVAANGVFRIYAFEDLVAYQLWYSLRKTDAQNFRVTIVRGVPGVAEDRAFFLPRGFDEVMTQEAGAAFREDEFWIAYRAAVWDEDAPVLQLLRARGYWIVRRSEMQAQGQRAFVVLVRRR